MSLACSDSSGAGAPFSSNSQQPSNSYPQTPESRPRVRTILVFPFENASRNPNLDWLCEGLSELTVERLQGPGRFVLARQDRLDVLEHLGLPAAANFSRATMITIGEEADADNIVFGRFSSDGKTVSFGASVLQLARPSLSPWFSVTGALTDLLSKHLQLSASLLCAISPEACPSGAPPAGILDAARPPSRMDAFRQYVRGLEDSNDVDRIADLRDAARLEPDWDAPAYELGAAHYARHDCEMALAWFSRVPPESVHGAEASFDAGVCHLRGRDAARAESAFEAVLQQPRPGSGSPLDSPEAHNNLGVALANLGKLSDAVGQFDKAAQLESGTADYWLNLGIARFLAGDAPGAASSLQRAVQLAPQDSDVRGVADEIQAAGAQGAGNRARQASLVARTRIVDRFDRTWLRPSGEPSSAAEPAGIRSRSRVS